MRVASQVIAVVQMIILSSILSSCAVYTNKFNCSDARGIPCTMLRDIDRKIDSGEIEEAYKGKKKNCSGRSCSKNSASEEEILPRVRSKTRIHIKDAMEFSDENINDLESIYF